MLATGGLATGGIELDRDGLREPVLGLPLADDPGEVRYEEGAFHEQPIDRVGVRVDAHMRPLAADGAVIHPQRARRRARSCAARCRGASSPATGSPWRRAWRRPTPMLAERAA